MKQQSSPPAAQWPVEPQFVGASHEVQSCQTGIDNHEHGDVNPKPDPPFVRCPNVASVRFRHCLFTMKILKNQTCRRRLCRPASSGEAIKFSSLAVVKMPSLNPIASMFQVDHFAVSLAPVSISWPSFSSSFSNFSIDGSGFAIWYSLTVMSLSPRSSRLRTVSTVSVPSG